MDDSMRGTICLVTGATSGIGKAAALGLASRGATVVMVARDRARGEAALVELQASGAGAGIDLLLADLSSQASIRGLADDFRHRYANLHVLVNCAAVFTATRQVSPDGLELMFATNHLAYFLLTVLLLDVLNLSQASGVFNVTAPSTVRLDFDDLQAERRFSASTAFGASKMGNLLFTFALARRLAGTDVTANAYHPGLVRSNLMRQAPVAMRLFAGFINLFAAVPAARAVAPLVQLAATHAGARSGLLFHGLKEMAPPAYARDEAIQERLWAESARLVGLPA